MTEEDLEENHLNFILTFNIVEAFHNFPRKKYNEFKTEVANLNSLIEVQNTLDPERIANDSEFQSTINSIDSKLNLLQTKIESDDFQAALINAKNLLYQNDSKSTKVAQR